MALRRILVCTRHFFPYSEAGGPPVSLAGLRRALAGEFDFWILSRADPPCGVPPRIAKGDADRWIETPEGMVRYASKAGFSLDHLSTLLLERTWDGLYLNSAFEPNATLRVLLAHRRLEQKIPLLLAPRGEFDPGALSLKKWKKTTFLFLSSLWDIYRDVTWHATGEAERERILRVRGKQSDVVVAPNIPDIPWGEALHRRDSRDGSSRLMFFSRISPKKNLETALQALAQTGLEVTLDAWGPVRDHRYWNQIQAAARLGGGRVTLTHRGMLTPAQRGPAMAGYDAMILPTLGENYGHSIIEALGAGLPVLTTDAVPWQGLEQAQSGWNLPPHDLNAWTERLAQLLDPANRAALLAMRQNAVEYAKMRSRSAESAQEARQAFRRVFGGEQTMTSPRHGNAQ